MSQDQANSEKRSMRDLKYWWSLQIFVRSLLLSALVFSVLIFWIERNKPSEGHVFERLPPIQGEWGKSSGSLRVESSKVGSTSILCSMNVLLVTSARSCRHANVPLHTNVQVTEVRIPILWGEPTYVKSIKSESHIFLERTDSQIAAIWMRQVRTEAGALSVQFLIIAYFLQILLVRKYFDGK